MNCFLYFVALLALALITTPLSYCTAQDSLDPPSSFSDIDVIGEVSNTDPSSTLPTTPTATISTTSNRRLLFHPTYSPLTTPPLSQKNDQTIGITNPDSFSTSSILSHSSSPLLNPHPFHIALSLPISGGGSSAASNSGVGESHSFTFELLPHLNTDLENVLVGFDWRKNTTWAEVKNGGNGGEVEWKEESATMKMPNWISYLHPSSSSSSSSSSGGKNNFTLLVNTTGLTSSPPPIILSFRAIVQWQCASTIQPEEDEVTGVGGAEEEGPTTTSPPATASSTSPASPSSSPLILLESLQSTSLLISLSLMPSITQRTTDLASSYTLTTTPNLLQQKSRLTNKRGDEQRSKGLRSVKMDWKDEIVYDCTKAQGRECDLCTSTDDSSSSTSSTPQFCTFPSGSFFNVQTGTLSVKSPIHLLGQVQINQGAVLEINHASSSSSSTSPDTNSLITSVSVIDSRDQYGRSQPIVNEGMIVVKNGHLLLYSPLIGRGTLQVLSGGSVEFISLLKPSNVHESGGAAANAWIFNRTSIESHVEQTSIGGVDLEMGERTTEKSRRKLLQQVEEATSPSSFNAPSASTSSDSSTAATNTTSSATIEASSTASASLDLSSSSSSSSTTTTTASSPASSSTAAASSPTSSPSPPSQPSPPTVFTPYSSSILISYSGTLIFSYGTFLFHSLLQSSLYDMDQSSSNTSGAGNGNNRFIVMPQAKVVFDRVDDMDPIASQTGASGSNNNSSNMNTSSSSAPSASTSPHHLLSFHQLHNLGSISILNTTLNFTQIQFFRSLGLLNISQQARVNMELSDNLSWNRVDGRNCMKGEVMSEGEKEERKMVIEMLMKDGSMVAAAAGNETDTTTASDTQSSSATQSSSLSTLISSLSNPASTPLSSSPTLSGVGLLHSGFLVFRFGKLQFTGGILAQKYSHIFVKKGTEWRVETEPAGSVDSIAIAAIAQSQPTLIIDPISLSYLHFTGVEFSLDGVLTLQRGVFLLRTPLLQIEGHGQIHVEGSESVLIMDNYRVNREVYIKWMTQSSVGAATNEDDPPSFSPSELVENPDAEKDPNADLYSLQPVNNNNSSTTPSSSPSSSSSSPPPSLPSSPLYRENLISRCLLSSGCQSLLVTSGATLILAPLTFFHLLPRASVTIETLYLEGGSVVMDSMSMLKGNAFVQNTSDPSSSATNIAALTAGIYIGNDSHVEMSDATIPSLALTEFRPARCYIGFGNLTGAGLISCGARNIVLDQVTLYPSWTSTSVFSPTIYSPPPSSTVPVRSTISMTSLTATLPKLAPSFKFGSDLTMSDRTVTLLDIYGFHSISSVHVTGSTLLAGTLHLNASLHIWPFDTSTGSSSASSSSSSANTSSISQSSSAPSSPLTTGISIPQPTPGVSAYNIGEQYHQQQASWRQMRHLFSSFATTTGTNSSSANSSITPSSSILLGIDSQLLFSSSLGFLPLSSSAHFSSVELGSLYESLPTGWSLDLEYLMTKMSSESLLRENRSGNASDTLSSFSSSSSSFSAKSQLLLKAYAPEYPASHAASLNQSTSDAESRVTMLLPAAATLVSLGWML